MEVSYFKPGIPKCSNLERGIFEKTKISKQRYRFENLKVFPMKEGVFPGYMKSTPVDGKY